MSFTKVRGTVLVKNTGKIIASGHCTGFANILTLEFGKQLVRATKPLLLLSYIASF